MNFFKSSAIAACATLALTMSVMTTASAAPLTKDPVAGQVKITLDKVVARELTGSEAPAYASQCRANLAPYIGRKLWAVYAVDTDKFYEMGAAALLGIHGPVVPLYPEGLKGEWAFIGVGKLPRGVSFISVRVNQLFTSAAGMVAFQHFPNMPKEIFCGLEGGAQIPS